MSLFRPTQVDFEKESETKKPTGEKTTEVKRLRCDTEDIIAFFAGIIALIFAIGIVFGKVPINQLTMGVLGFSGVGAVIAQIIKARKQQKLKERSK